MEEDCEPRQPGEALFGRELSEFCQNRLDVIPTLNVLTLEELDMQWMEDHFLI